MVDAIAFLLTCLVFPHKLRVRLRKKLLKELERRRSGRDYSMYENNPSFVKH